MPTKTRVPEEAKVSRRKEVRTTRGGNKKKNGNKSRSETPALPESRVSVQMFYVILVQITGVEGRTGSYWEDSKW